ncbi:hypothetical protein SAMN05192529_10968 [Arachidicoccus rhizosphaerae]|uniref:Uncharacterized protein n=1 Tax=Arachidicoccus rhizosphaerae TaxID=551991 RepID=A0A1H3YUQ8_9BACT|nr:hypothetical protein SAMN05192529_10968 [Arachidicoccus rhizosphaerae]
MNSSYLYNTNYKTQNFCLNIGEYNKPRRTSSIQDEEKSYLFQITNGH